MRYGLQGERRGPERIESLNRELCFEKRNIVLIGMPGCGKTTLGALLSSALGRPLRDTDVEIEARAGMPIAELFRRYGEARVRELECGLLREVCATGGAVVATGGGAVLRQENVDAMKKNGTVVFLDRPPQSLLPSDERPLADNPEKISALFRARYPIYTAAADLTLPVRGTPEQSLKELLEILI